MKSIGIGAVALAASLCLSASAGERAWYFGIEGGAEFAGDYGNNSGYGVSSAGSAVFATIGRKFGTRISLEGELGYRSADVNLYSPGTINQISGMVNGVYEAPLTEEISLSVGAGIGVDQVEVKDSYYGFAYSISEIELAAQLKFGLTLALDESIAVTTNYRVMTTFVENGTGIDNNTLTVGLRIAF
ncbi:MAG: outer membrane beta-barrel protein [Micropepsaceae bacterium]